MVYDEDDDDDDDDEEEVEDVDDDGDKPSPISNDILLAIHSIDEKSFAIV